MDEKPENGQQNQPKRSWHFFIGIGIGLVPLILVLLTLGTSGPLSINLASAGGIIYVGVIVASIVCLIIQRVRYIGYGLLTMVFVAPIVYAIACTVTVLMPHPA